IAEKADGLKDQRFHTLRGDGLQGLFHSGPKPRSAARALTLIGKPPAWNLRQPGGHELRGSARILVVRIGALPWPETRPGVRFLGRLDGAKRYAVRCKK